MRGRDGRGAGTRAREAIARARAGARVALVSSGDAGVHGMAARTLAHGGAASRSTVIPGVTAALAAAARVGAPLADDWATLSLSDLHVPWETVERRLTALAASGIALALYNPRSATRTEPFERALSILRAHRDPDTPVGRRHRRRPRRRGDRHDDLEHLDPATVTMRTLVLVAGETAEWAGEGRPASRSGGARDRASRGRRTRATRRCSRSPRPSCCATRGWSSTTGRRWTRSSRSPRRRPRSTASAARPGARRCRKPRSTRCWSSSAAPQDVVRLKSGDPFVASRGAEEAVALTNAGIAVNVVPGVSAALAAPAAAGIPLMLRQLSVTATFVDGNDDDEHAEPPDWATLARLGGTLVILTGRGRIQRTAAKLIAGGRDPKTPIAAISAASAPASRCCAARWTRLPAPAPAARDLRRRRRRRTRPMHIPDGFLTGEAAAARHRHRRGGRRRLPAQARRRRCARRTCPLAGLAAAFFLVGEAPMVPITVGTQGHLLGGALAVVLLGPWSAR